MRQADRVECKILKALFSIAGRATQDDADPEYAPCTAPDVFFLFMKCL